MSIEKLKIEAGDIALYGVAAAPDKLEGTAQENKELFDRLIRECFALKYNELIQRLESMEAGTGVFSETVRYIRISESGSFEISIDGDSWITVGGTYTLPIASADTLGGVKLGSGLAIDENGVLSVTATATEELPNGDEVEY